MVSETSSPDETLNITRNKTRKLVENVIEKSYSVTKEQLKEIHCKNKTVRVPEIHIEDRYVYNDTYVDEEVILERPVYVEKENIVILKEDKIVENIVDVEIPFFVPDMKNQVTNKDVVLPTIVPVYKKEEYVVRLPRFIEIPVFDDVYTEVNGSTKKLRKYIELITDFKKNDEAYYKDGDDFYKFSKLKSKVEQHNENYFKKMELDEMNIKKAATKHTTPRNKANQTSRLNNTSSSDENEYQVTMPNVQRLQPKKEVIRM